MGDDGFWVFLQTSPAWVILFLYATASAAFFVYALVRQWLWIRASHEQVMRPIVEANKTLEAANKELLSQNTMLIREMQIVSKFFEEAKKVKESP